ncbi:hypothetical protein F5Y19DRAFT_122599 [Xylariaceae sp. FL1651]|nr:hypothetical protein F5Y19DRAFT_122599 [Xylariaceae sp. FL1651]
MEANGQIFWDGEGSDYEINISMVSKPTASVQALCNATTSLCLSASTFASASSSTHAHKGHVKDPTPVLGAFEPLNLAFGEVPQKRFTFVPFKLMQRYPHMYVGRSNHEQVANFFKETLLSNRLWDFFVQRDPSTVARDPLIMVPSVQFEQYLSFTNRQLDKELAIPRGNARGSFFLTFGEWDSPCPRFLGRANSTNSLDALKARISTLPADDLSRPTPAGLQAYKDKVDEIYSSLKRVKSKKDPEVARKRRMQRQKDWGRMLKRAQRYLGLRQSVANVSSENLATTAWDVTQSVPFKARESVRFVCVDVESYERNNSLVTEIGLATLDTDDTMDVPPGERGENWFSFLEVHHFRIAEYSYLVNTEFVKGCPDAFNFGDSQMVSIKDIARIIGNIIGDNDSKDKTPVILVGHDIAQDLNYLLKVGYNPWCVSQIVDEIDTKAVFQRMERNPNGRSLQVICGDLGVPGYNYHNAGNDAVYTLRAMIAMAVKRTVDGSDRELDSFTPGNDEWTDGDMDDGGYSIRSAMPVEKTQASQPIGGLQHVQW